MTICQVCQKENPAGAEYCEDCGAALSAPAPAPVGAGVSSAGASSPAGQSASAAPTPASIPTAPPSSASSSAAASPEVSGKTPSGDASMPAAGPSAGQGTAPAAPPAPSSAGSQAQARLVAVRYGAPTGEEIPLLGERLVVGRFDPETGPVDVDLTALDAGGHISRQHGELYREANGLWTVRDLGSTNGVFVKGGDEGSFGPRITSPRPLQDGDEVAFGNARFIFKSS